VMRVADISFCPSLLTSWAANVKAAHHYYDTWPLYHRAKLGPLLQ
jgi:hypothetical protein